jgi:SAM-dependent methyltransferase
MMGKQSQVFLEGEGAAWNLRNKDAPKLDPDPVIKVIEHNSIKPTSILEIGCGDGWRLKQLAKQYNCSFAGIDPALPARWPDINNRLFRGTAENLSFALTKTFDLIIYGFCLYLCDPEDYLRIATEADRVLQDGGHIIIHDFYSETPYKTPYKHRDGIFSYHMNFWKLWHWHPHYRLVTAQHASTDQVVSILRKDTKRAFPVQP